MVTMIMMSKGQYLLTHSPKYTLTLNPNRLIVTCQRCGKLVNAYQMSMHAPACHRSGGPGSAGIRDEKSVLGVGQGGHLQSLRENTHLADETVTTKAALSDKYKISHKIYPLEE